LERCFHLESRLRFLYRDFSETCKQLTFAVFVPLRDRKLLHGFDHRSARAGRLSIPGGSGSEEYVWLDDRDADMCWKAGGLLVVSNRYFALAEKTKYASASAKPPFRKTTMPFTLPSNTQTVIPRTRGGFISVAMHNAAMDLCFVDLWADCQFHKVCLVVSGLE